jgi:cbb3-type cytochrome oxidase cytochrome c subunit
MERFGASFLIAGVVTFLLGFFLQGAMPIITLRNLKIASVEEVAGEVIPEFTELAQDYPDEFRKYFGEVSSASQVKAVEIGRAVYISEACWHCHSQFVRPVSRKICASARCRSRRNART